MNLLDPIGAGLSLICTYYFTKGQRIAWLLGIIAIIVNSILYWQKGIYGSLILEAVYFLSMIYGWFKWHSGNYPSKKLPIRYLSLKQIAYLCGIAVLGILLLANALALTDSDVPYWDAMTTTLSLIAQALLCLKIIHCWILWFVVDALVALLQLYKGIPFHSAIHWSYLILAVLGYFRWRKIYKTECTQMVCHAS